MGALTSPHVLGIRSFCLMIADRNRLGQHPLMKRFPFFFLVIFPICAFAQAGLPDKPYIYVEGKAEIEKSADMMMLRFNVVGRAPQQPKANEEVQREADKIFAVIKDRKIGDNDVIAEDIRSEPVFEKGDEYSDKRGKVIGYKVSRMFQIKLRDLTAFPKLVEDLINIGGVEFYGIEGALAKQKEIENEMWEKALANARDQADKTLKPLNMKIDSVFAVSPVAFPEIEAGILGASRYAGAMQQSEVERVIVTPQYRFAPVRVTQRVHVIYLISTAT
jgi:uncharacterized protein YggE